MPVNSANSRHTLSTFPASFPGMTPGMGLLQVGDGQPGVVLEGVEGLVAEDLLDVVHVGPAPEQLGGATAAERVGGHRDLKAGLRGIPVQEPAHGVVGQAAATGSSRNSARSAGSAARQGRTATR